MQNPSKMESKSLEAWAAHTTQSLLKENQPSIVFTQLESDIWFGF